jgi:putative ABC transport system permease protein
MNLWRIAWHYLWNRKLTTCVTILSVALGVAMIGAVLTLRDETRRRFEEEGQAFDIVMGGKGSPLQLVLSTVYLMDNPNANIKYLDYLAIKRNPEVAAAFPISMGDSYRGHRVVGTTPDLLQHEWIMDRMTGETKKPFVLVNEEEHRFFTGPFEAVLGYDVAEQSGLKVGDTLIASHNVIAGDGEEHPPYTVVGLLQRSHTPYDRAIMCDLESVWVSHAHDEEPTEAAPADESNDDHAHEGDHDHAHEGESFLDRVADLEVSAVLIQLHSPGLRWQIRDRIDDETGAIAAIPVEEIMRLFNQLLSPVQAMLKGVGFLVVIVSALSILTGLYLSILQRKRDLAIMRALGASSTDVFGLVILEGFWVTLLGIGFGWLLGNGVSFILGIYLESKYGMSINAFAMPGSETLQAYAMVALIGGMAGILPARQAYRSDVVRDLSES